MQIRWTGASGIDGVGGHESVEIEVATKDLIVSVHTNAIGSGNVLAQAAEECPTSKTFAIQVQQQESLLLGTIPAGTPDPWVETDSNVDIDIQLVDTVADVALIRWPDGLLNSAGPSSTTCQGIPVDYSGYNGTGGQRGDERIEIGGTTTRPLHLFVYGYEASSADVRCAPEPSGVAALASGATALWALRRRRRRQVTRRGAGAGSRPDRRLRGARRTSRR